jgi:pSer/pThr/pTyr-binding forkhead associated (FHA) protein
MDGLGPACQGGRHRCMERLVLSWVDKPFAFDLRPGLNRLGRNPTNDFRVADASVSSFHCEVTLEPGGKVHVRDLASTNGTFVDGVETLDGELKPGQTLRLGFVEFNLEKVTVADTPSVPEVALANTDQTQIWARSEQPKTLLGKLTQTLKIRFSK